ncbi:uncharacterized protein LOC127582269 [Pristis pectinata]|uniref:uncharacterized protein LOC127582269 n=1 Tax=Pristis pectinata TaxID=685728 RepID=UPI00223DEBC2|nr:uncharacterized protein LOC127582269 [Pristis pectinata]
MAWLASPRVLGQEEPLVPGVNASDDHPYGSGGDRDQRAGAGQLSAPALSSSSQPYSALLQFLGCIFARLSPPSLAVCAQCFCFLCILSVTLRSPSTLGSRFCLASCLLCWGFPPTMAGSAAPPSILFLNASAQVHRGVEFTLLCVASGVPEPWTSWSFRDRPVTAGDRYGILTENGMLTVRKAKPNTEGVYGCEAVNEAGSAKRSVTISVSASVKPLWLQSSPSTQSPRLQSETQSSLASIDQQSSVPEVSATSEVPVTSTETPFTVPSLPLGRPIPPQSISTGKSFPFHPKPTIRPFPSPTVSTMNTSPTLATPVTAELPLNLKQHSAPINIAPDLTRLFSKMNASNQTSSVTSLLKIHQPADPGDERVSAEGLRMFAENGTLTKSAAETNAWNLSYTTRFQPPDATSGTIIREEARVKLPSPFSLEKHDIPIVIGVTVSLILIFITMCVYSVRQKKAGSRETERRMLPNSRRQSHDQGHLEMNTHDNRAFVEDSVGASTEHGHGERESVSTSSLKQPAAKAITVRAEFALVRQNEHHFSVSGNSSAPIPYRSPPEGEPQEMEPTVLGGSRSSHAKGMVDVPHTWEKSPSFQGRPLTAVVMVEPNSSSCRKAEVLTRSKSIPCCLRQREEQLVRSSGLLLDGEAVGPSCFILQQLVHPGVMQGHTNWSRALLDTDRKRSEMVSDVLVPPQESASSSLPAPETSSAVGLSVPTPR